MRNLIWGNTFIRAYKRTVRRHPELRENIEKTLKMMVEDIYNVQLETHKLKGKLSGSWACSVSYNLRIIFEFVKSKNESEDDILLLEIGTHDEVY